MAQIKSLNWLLWSIEALMPVLFWLHRSVPAKYAPKFFLYMQEIFNGNTLDELQGLDMDLQHGTDHLLRVLANAALENVSGEIRPYDYSAKHMRGAYAYFSDYFEKKKGGTRTFSADEEGWMNLSTDTIGLLLIKQFSTLTSQQTGLNEVENAQTRLGMELLNYLLSVRMENTLLDVPEAVMREFQALIEPYFRKRFGISIPGTETDEDLARLEEVKIVCHTYWKDEEV
jgi:hypothetical protein